MKYLAKCPNCDTKFTRPEHFFKFQWSDMFTCDACRCRYREKTPWVSLPRMLIIVATGVLVGEWLIDRVFWLNATVGVLGIFAIFYMAYPYLVPYILVSAHPHCKRCAYDLFGLNSSECPECGEPIKTEGETPAGGR